MIISETKALIELCKEVCGLAKKSRDAEIIAKVIDLQSAVMSLQASILQSEEDHREAMSEARQKLEEAEAKYRELQSLREGDDSNPEDHLSGNALKALLYIRCRVGSMPLEEVADTTRLSIADVSKAVRELAKAKLVVAVTKGQGETLVRAR